MTEDELIAWTRPELAAEVLRLEKAIETLGGEMKTLVEQRDGARRWAMKIVELDQLWPDQTNECSKCGCPLKGGDVIAMLPVEGANYRLIACTPCGTIEAKRIGALAYEAKLKRREQHAREADEE